jgi:hypothetical protein
MSASFAAWSPVFYELKRLLPRKLIGGAMRRPGWGWPLSDHSTPASCTNGRTLTPSYRASGMRAASSRDAPSTSDNLHEVKKGHSLGVLLHGRDGRARDTVTSGIRAVIAS